jgi:hypothetical protein
VTVTIFETLNVGVKVEMVGKDVIAGVRVSVEVGVLVFVGTGDGVVVTFCVT